MRRTASTGIKADMKGGVGTSVYRVDEDPRALKTRDLEARVVLHVTPHPAKQRRHFFSFLQLQELRLRKRNDYLRPHNQEVARPVFILGPCLLAQFPLHCRGYWDGG